MEALKILIADDHQAIRRGVRVLIEAQGWEVCGEAVNGKEAVELAKQLQPQIVLLDVTMPEMNGLDAARVIHKDLPKCQILIFSQNDPELMRKESARAGARGFVPKSEVARQLIPAIAALAGEAERSGAMSGAGSKPTPGEGSHKEAENKLKSEESEREAAAPPRAQPDGGAFKLAPESEPRPRIVVADDDEGLRSFMAELLRPYSEVAATADGEAALAEARERGADLVLSDVVMPRLDGLGLLKAIRADEALKDASVILLSAKADEETRIAGLTAGADDYLVKPVAGRELLARVKAQLAVARMRKKAVELARDLRLETETLASIVATSDDAIVGKNLNGIITTWNGGAERIFGYSAAEAIGKNIALIIPADRMEEEVSILARVRSGIRVDHFQTVRRHKDGSLLDISVTVSPLKNAAGQVVGASKVARDITKQKQAESALRESEERFRAIVETTPECVKLVAADGTVVHMNGSGLRMVGAATADEVIGTCVYDLIAPEHRQKFREFNERVCQGERLALEYDVVDMNGGRHHMETHAVPLRSRDGSISQLAVTRDVTQRKSSDSAMKQQRERFDLMTKASQVGFWFCDLPFDKLIWDARVKEHFWLAEDAEVTIETFYERMHPEDREPTRLAIEESIAQDTQYDIEYRTLSPDGRQKWIRAIGRTFYGTAGVPARFDGLTMDITERKTAADALRESEERLRAFVNASTYVVYRISADWREMRQLEGFNLALGAEQLGTDWLSKYIHPEDQARVAQKVQEAIRNKSTFELEHRVLRADGSTGWTLSRAVPRFDQNGKIIEWFGAASDVSARREAEENYRELAETLDSEVRARTMQLEQRNREMERQSEQVRDLSWRLLRAQDDERRHIARELHDSAGQTIAVLAMSLDRLIHKMGTQAPEISTDAQSIQETVHQLQREVRTASYLLHPPLLDEIGLASALSWYVRGLVERSGLEVKLDIAEDFGRLPHDMELTIFRLVQECLTNIHRHSGSKTAAIRIIRREDQIQIEISDQGKGMSTSELAAAQSSRSGVGISGMRERLRQFHAQMQIESDETGTRVTVVIPVAKITSATTGENEAFASTA
jgi:PAS domain S-box-containing protein